MIEYKQQHFVTKAYLRAWNDPTIPEGQYLWFVSKNGKDILMKSPRNVFSEEDFYTVYDEEGNRNLELENELKNIEDGFISVRNNKIMKKEPLNDEDRLKLSLFISTTYTRTKYQKIDQREIWDDLLSIYSKRHINVLFPNLFHQVEQLRNQPMPFFIFNIVNRSIPYLLKMNITIIETKRGIGFITSDNPVIWVDPSLYFPNFPIAFYGLGSPFLEIFMPVSPNFLVNLSWSNSEGYKLIDDNPDVIDSINCAMVENAIEGVILNHNTPNYDWFNTSLESTC